MNCETARQLWHEGFDGELDAAGQASLELHLRGCVDCRSYAEEMDAVAGALDGLRLCTNQIGRTRAAAPRQRLQVFGSLAAAIALLLTAGVFLVSSDTEHSRIVATASPSASAAPPPFASEPAAPSTVHLAHCSAAQYIPVPRESSAPNVHLFVLFQKPVEHAAGAAD